VLLSLPEDQAEFGDPTHRSLADIGARSVACVPIAHAGRPLGVLYLDGRDPAHAFSGSVPR
jgi:GAF domain-containing protein